MQLKFIILIGSLRHCMSQFSVGDLEDQLWGLKNSSTAIPEAPNENDIFGVWDVPDGTNSLEGPANHPNYSAPSADECECVPYYICDQKATAAKHNDYGGIIDIRIRKKPVNCSHYLLQCCDDEDLSDYEPEPTPTTTVKPLKPVGCGYRNLDATKTPTDDTSQFGEFPWVVAIYYANSDGQLNYTCGGSLIHPEVVLTAAHCLRDLTKQPKIRAGEWDSRSTEEKYPHQDRDVATVILHEHYSGISELHNDIALLFLKKPVGLAPHINVVCLPPPDIVADKAKCISTGWGTNSVLSKLDLPVVPGRRCQENLRKTRLGHRFNLHRSFVCAGGEGGKDTCKGDGGSPLVCPIEGKSERYHLVGIVSWGIGCGGYRIPGVYVNVPYFRKWIDEKLKKNLLDTSVYEAN